MRVGKAAKSGARLASPNWAAAAHVENAAQTRQRACVTSTATAREVSGNGYRTRPEVVPILPALHLGGSPWDQPHPALSDHVSDLRTVGLRVAWAVSEDRRVALSGVRG